MGTLHLTGALIQTFLAIPIPERRTRMIAGLCGLCCATFMGICGIDTLEIGGDGGAEVGHVFIGAGAASFLFFVAGFILGLLFPDCKPEQPDASPGVRVRRPRQRFE
jgi:hypothetical protein